MAKRGRKPKKDKKQHKWLGKEKLRVMKVLDSGVDSINDICKRYHINRSTLWRWKKQYDGTEKSLEPRFSRKGTHHPNEQTAAEKKHIQDLHRRNPDNGLNELYGKLCHKYKYKRNIITLYRFLKSIDALQTVVKKAYVPKPYDTPTDRGGKWQMDVKYVPESCYKGRQPFEQLYQYTMLDEATRKRFVYGYREKTQESTVDFVNRAIAFFGYTPKKIQTDNGMEFTYLRKLKDNRIHKLDTLCKELGIEHVLIRPRTPRHNGKVERSHGLDQQRFYNKMTYFSFEDYQTQLAKYRQRSNNIPTSVLRDETDGHWLTPNEKDALLKVKE